MTVLLFAAGVLIERRARERAAVRAHAPHAREARARLARRRAARRAGRRSRSATAASAARSRTAGTTSPARSRPRSNDPGRLIETGNVRTIYWARALDVWREHELAGAGAGSFAQAQLRFRDQPTQGRHAHGYVHQTLADLGLIGLAREPRRRSRPGCSRPRATLGLRGGAPREPGRPSAPGCWRLRWWRSCSACTRRSTGPGSSRRSRSPASSAPAGSPAAGRSRSPPPARRRDGRRPPALQMPRGRALRGRAALAAGAVVARRRWPPWRSRSRGAPTTRATRRWRCLSEGDFAGARAAAERRARHQPAVGRALLRAGRDRGRRRRPRRATRPLEDAVRLEPASPEAWRRLGRVLRRRRSTSPARAMPVLRGALFLDPTSALNRAAYLVALRARSLKRAEALAAARAEAARRAARRKARAAPAAQPHRPLEQARMRKLIYSMTVSLDGFIAGPDGDFDWRRRTRSCTGSTTSRCGRSARISRQEALRDDALLGDRRREPVGLGLRARVRPHLEGHRRRSCSRRPSRRSRAMPGWPADGVAEEVAKLKGATGQGPGRRRRRPGLHLHRAGPGRRVPAVRQPGRAGRRHALLPGAGGEDQPGAGRDADVRLARRLPSLPARALDRRRDPRPATEGDQRAPHQRHSAARVRLDALERERLQQRAQRAGGVEAQHRARAGRSGARTRSAPTSAPCTRPWNGTATSSSPPGRSTRRTSDISVCVSATCSSTCTQVTTSKLASANGSRPSVGGQAQLSSGCGRARPLDRGAARDRRP